MPHPPASISRVRSPHQYQRTGYRILAILAVVSTVLGNDHLASADDQLASESGELSPKSSACDKAQRRLPESFAALQTPRFILFSDAQASLTNQHARWVERTYEEFQRFARECDLRPLPLRHKLVGILFESKSDYQTFARTQDGMANAAFSGYYSPRHDRVVFSLDIDDDAPPAAAGKRKPSVAGASAANEKPVLGFDSSTTQGHEVAADAEHGDGCCGNGSAAKCVHETIHQLMFHTRIMSPEIQYPLWICEGLSTAFETNDPELPFGPDRDFGPRREVFRTMMDRGELMRLRELVTLAPAQHDDQVRVRTIYHQSYALVTWMCRHRMTDMREYLAAMLKESPGRLASARHLELFEQAFGDVQSVERDWLVYERESPGSTLASR